VDKKGTVIAGCGQAGMQTAIRLREYGYRGPITVVGAEQHEAYERPPLSKEFLTETAPEPTWIAPGGNDGIAVKRGCAVEKIDRPGNTVRLSDGTCLGYTSLVLATGGSCRRLALPGDVAFHEVRTIEDAQQLSARFAGGGHVTVVGAGVIGLEVAASARKRGLAVSVVEMGSFLMGRNMPADFSERIKSIHTERGVRFHMNDAVRAVRPSDGRYRVELTSRQAFETDCLVVGIGITPNVALAEAAGLEVGNGIYVAGDMRTSDPAIFAVGDVACRRDPATGREERLESWHNANHTADIAAAAICGLPLPAAEIPWFWTDQHDVNVQVAGRPLLGDQTVWREDGRAVLAFYVAGGRLVGACTMNAGRDMAVIRRMMRAGLSPSAEDLANPGLPLRALLKAGQK
jgi:3-phenylpropionate/trans-cinnamate dioxygenase ferredoxin reductase subunit